MKTSVIFLILLITGGWFVLSDEINADKAWDYGNRYYQSELYENALPYFYQALTGYRETGSKVKINTTLTCLAYCHYNLGNKDQAERYLDQINVKVRIKDAEWNRSIADLYGFFSNDEMQILYLKRAKKYE